MSLPPETGKPAPPARREPYQRLVHNLPGVAGRSAAVSFPGLPTGKRVVIETASVRVQLPPGQRVQAVLGTNVARGAPTLALGQLFFVLTLQGTFNGVNIFTASHPTRLYGSGSTPVSFTVLRNATSGTFAFELSLSGYLEDDAPWPI
jgi:hypothetical protein